MNAPSNPAAPRSIFPILLVNFIGILGYSVIIPILIYIVEDFGGNGFIYGLLGATYPFFQFIGAPILGQLSDRIGRKKVLIVSQLGTFLSWGLFLLAFALPRTLLFSQESSLTGDFDFTLPLLVVFVARMLDGFTGGNISVANAYLSDISTEETRDANFGRMGASASLGFVIGPALAGGLAATALGELSPLLIAAGISLVAIFVIQFRLQESLPCVVDTGNLTLRNFRKVFQAEVRECYTEGQAKINREGRSGWSSVLAIDGVPRLYAIYFLTFLAFSLFYAALPIYANEELKWSAAQLGSFLAYFSLVMVFVQGPVLRYVSKRFANSSLIAGGSVLLAIGLALMYTQNSLTLYLAATVMAFGNGVMWASFLSNLAGKGSASQQGRIQGYGNSMGSMASMFGLVLGGVLFLSLGSMVFLIGAGIFVLVVLLAFSDSGAAADLAESPSPEAA